MCAFNEKGTLCNAYCDCLLISLKLISYIGALSYSRFDLRVGHEVQHRVGGVSRFKRSRRKVSGVTDVSGILPGCNQFALTQWRSCWLL